MSTAGAESYANSLHGVVVLPLLLDSNVGEVDKGVVQLLHVACVFGRAEPGETVDEEVHPERPAEKTS